MRPSLTFFCELPTPAINEFFCDATILTALKKLNANLSMGLLDLSPERAGVVRKLNRAGIPVTAWILLPKEQGYWTNLDTVTETTESFAVFQKWQSDHHLEIAAVGLDIEPSIHLVAALSQNPKSQALDLGKRVFKDRSKQLAEMNDLVRNIKAAGYAVETYQFPTVVDERSARSSILTKTLGLPAVDCDREVLMLYSSFFPTHADSILWSYALQTRAVGVGSTGGGVEIEGVPELKKLRWIELKRDLLLASQHAEHLYIFSLEGCVASGFMERLINLDWDTQVIPPVRSALGISLIRKVFQGLLWSLSHPLEFLLGVFLVSKVYRALRKLFS